MTPTAVTAAKKRKQTHAELHHAATITINGASYTAAVILGKLEPVMKDDQTGWEKRQTLTAALLKTRLTTAPAKDALLVHNNVSFLIISVGGQNPTDIAWHLTAIRRAS